MHFGKMKLGLAHIHVGNNMQLGLAHAQFVRKICNPQNQSSTVQWPKDYTFKTILLMRRGRGR